jgi:hypothetical protein
MRLRRFLEATLILILGAFAGTAEAQSEAPTANVTFTGGYVGFVDESLINHVVIGGGVEWVLTPRVAIGPEVLYMVGPESDRDLFVLGVARFGILPFSRPVVPFATVGGGFMAHWDRFGSQTFSSSEGAFVFGGGVRVAVTRNVYVAPEFTVGWELHMRASANVGIRLR